MEQEHIFISYSRANKDFVERITQDLLDRNVPIWIDRLGLTPGTGDWEQALRDAIQECKAVLLIASPDSRQSHYVKDEIGIAQMYGRKIFPIWADGDEWMDSIRMGLGHTQFIDARGDAYATAVDTIVETLATEADRPSTLHMEVLPTFEPDNPYVGLKAFQEEDAQYFFGRDTLISELIDALDDNITKVSESRGMASETAELVGRMLAVVGPSGSGKSSVLMAGVIPRLKKGAIAGSENWVYLPSMYPGTRPIEELAVAISSTPNFRYDFEVVLTNLQSSRGLHVVAKMLSDNDPDKKVVLYIDQFEELFTQTLDEKERDAFIALLLEGMTDPKGSLIVLLSMRADFYDRPMQYLEFAKLLEHNHRAVPPMSVPELRDVIRKPAALPNVKLSFDTDLVGDLLFEVRGETGALPLLQFTLEQLFEKRSGHLLTREAYRDIGGVLGALAKRADDTYHQLPDDSHRALARSLFLRLIDPGATEQDTTRRRAPLSELELEDDEQTRRLQYVMQKFVDARLLVTSRIADIDGIIPTVEVSHEALIREWELLRGWLYSAREDIHFQEGLSEDARAWIRSGSRENDDRLYRGNLLAQAIEWADRNNPAIDELTFLRASEALEAKRAEADRVRREKEERTANRAQQFQRASAVLGIFVVLAFIAAIFATIQVSNSGNEVATAFQQIDDAEEQIALANETIQVADTQVAGVQPTVDAADTQVANVIPTLEQANSLVQLADTQVAGVQPTVNAAETQAALAIPTLEAAQNELAAAQQLVQLADTQVANVEPTLLQANLLVSGAETQVAGVQPTVDAADTEIAEVVPTIQFADTQVAGVRPTVDAAETQVAQVEPTLQQANILVVEAQTQVAGVEPTVNAADTQVAGVQPTVDAADTQVAEVEPTLQQANILAIGAQTQVAGIQPTIDTADTQVAAVQPTLDAAGTEVANVAPTLEQANLLAVGAQTQVAGVQPTVDAADTQVAGVQPTVDAADTQVANIAPTLDSANRLVVVAQTQVAGVQPTVDAADTQVAGIQPTVDAADTQVANVAPTLEQANLLAVGAQTQVAGVQPTIDAADTQVAGVQPTVDAADTQVANVAPTLESANILVVGAQTQVAGVQPTIDAADTQVAGVIPTFTAVAEEIVAQSSIANSLSIIRTAQQLLQAGDPDLAIALIIEAYNLNPRLSEPRLLLNDAIPLTVRLVLPASGIVEFDPSGRFLAVANGSTLRIWDVAARQPFWEVDAGSTINAIAFAPSGDVVAIGTGGGVGSWHIIERREIFFNTGASVTAIDYHPEQAIIASGDSRGNVVITDGGIGSEIMRHDDYGDRITHIEFQGNGGTVFAYSLTNSNQQAGVLQLLQRTASFNRPLTTYRFLSPDGRYALNGADGSNNFLTLWQANNSVRIKPFERGNFTTDYIDEVDFSSDGRFIMVHSENRDYDDRRQNYWVRGRYVAVWDISTSEEIIRMQAPEADPTNWDIYSVAYSNSGRFAITGGIYGPLHSVSLWDVSTGEEIRRFTGHTSPITEVGFHPNDLYAYSVSQDGARIWDILSLESNQIDRFDIAGASLGKAGISGDDQNLYVAYDDKSVGVWTVEDGAEVLGTRFTTGTQNVVAFNPAKPQAFVSTTDSAELWDIDSRTFLFQFDNDVSRSITAAQFSPDGSLLFISARGTIVLDTTTLEQVDTLAKRFTTADVTGNNEFLAFSQGSGVAVYDIRERSDVCSYSATGGRVNDVTYSPAGDKIILAVGEPDNKLVLLDAATCNLLFDMLGHVDNVNSVAFSPSGLLAVSGGEDRRIILWDVLTGLPLQTFEGHTDIIRQVMFSSDGSTAISVSDNIEDGIYKWNIRSTGDTIEWVQANRYVEPLSCSQRRQFNVAIQCENGVLPDLPTSTPIPTITPIPTTTLRPTWTPTNTAIPMGTIRTDNNLSVRLRTGPGDGFRVLGSVESGTRVVIIEVRNDVGWVNVELPNGQVGWVIQAVVR